VEKPRIVRKAWVDVKTSYIITQWNEIENTGSSVKNEICKEISRRMKSWPQKVCDCTEDQVRRKIERVLSDKDPRIPTWQYWVRNNGSVRSDKSTSISTPKVTARTERVSRTYSRESDEEAGVEDEEEFKLKTPKKPKPSSKKERLLK